MAKEKSQQKSAKPTMPKKISRSSCVEREAEGMSCILCYLVKEGVKKAYSGIRGLRVAKSKQPSTKDLLEH